MKSILIQVIAACMGASISQAAENVALGSLDLSTMRQGYGRPQINQSITGKPITLGGKVHESGVGSH